MNPPSSEVALTPRETVSELDRYIVGQNDAKRAVAIAIRNRWRRQKLDAEMREEVSPKNIILIGPTGVGKTEIARRLAGLIRAPFVKVEATSYTQVGYVGRDVESMIRDLAEKAHGLVKKEEIERQSERADQAVEEKLLQVLLPSTDDSEDEERGQRTRDRFRKKLRAGELDERMVEIEAKVSKAAPNVQVFSGPSLEQMGMDLQSMFQNLGSDKKKINKHVSIKEAREIFRQEEAEKLVDPEKIREEALQRAQNSGIVFIDEIDKVSGQRNRQGPDVSGEGVQRDLLPIVEGSNVQTRYGTVKTDHILFIAAGAFHVSKPSDLIPELQGRFPIRVELSALERGDLLRILSEPKNALVRQYTLLLATEGVTLEFTDEALEEIARIAEEVNKTMENIGARRLHTIMENLLDDWLFYAPDRKGQTLKVDGAFVREKLENILQDEDLTRFIL